MISVTDAHHRSESCSADLKMAESAPPADPPQTAPDENVVKWMPIVVPLMALFLAVMVAIIDTGVLR
jgi:hypothetical protein